jgi:MFS family permease
MSLPAYHGTPDLLYVTKGLGVSAHSPLIGLFYSAAALGGLGAAACASWLGCRFGQVRAALAALAASPPLLAALAVSRQVPAALGLLTAWAVTYSAVTINAITARQIRIPDRLQGRVNTTARLLGWGVGWPIGAAIAGVLAGAIGIRAVYLLAAVGLAVLAVPAWLSPLRAERPPAPAHPRQPAVRNVTVPPHYGPEGGTATVDDGGKAE